jgi:hypothetical protein
MTKGKRGGSARSTRAGTQQAPTGGPGEGNGAESRPATALTRHGRSQGAPWLGPHANARTRRRGGRHGAAAQGRERAQAERAWATQRGGGAHPQHGRARQGGGERDGGEWWQRTGARVGRLGRRRGNAGESLNRARGWRRCFARRESGGGGATAVDCGSERLGAEGAAARVLGRGRRRGGGSNGERGRARRSGVGGEAPGGHAGQASGRRRAPPRGCPTGGRGRPGDAEGAAADARAQVRGRERGG